MGITEFKLCAVYFEQTYVLFNGGWGEWSDWAACSVSCGNGLHNRTRECNDPPPQPEGPYCMVGPNGTNTTGVESCNSGSCPSK